jgi:outer membrane murein-binding lipoprotein Lpp
MMKGKRTIVFAALALGSLVVGGCSSSPSKEELNQLEATRAEIASLSQKANALKTEKTTQQGIIAIKEAKLKNCQDDQIAVAAKLKSGQ